MHRKEEQQEDLAFFGNQERKQEELQSVETETETERRSKKNRLFTGCGNRNRKEDLFFLESNKNDLVSDSGSTRVFIIFTEKIIQSLVSICRM